MRVACVVIGLLLAGLVPAAAQTGSPPPSSSPPPSTQPLPGGSDNIGVRVDLRSFFGSRKGPCERIRDEMEKLRADIEKRGCKKQEAAVAAARQDLENIIDEIGAERARRDALHADARAARARHQQAQANLRAAQTAAARADDAVSGARDNLRRVLQNHWNNGPEWFPLEPPAEPGWRAINVEPGIDVYMRDDEGVWTPNRIAEASSQLRRAMNSSAAGRNARGALQQALQNQAAAQQALAEAEAAATAAGDDYFNADQAVHGLPPVDAKLEPAERRLEKALAALEKCRKKQTERLERIAQLEEALRECDKLETLANRLEIAAEDGAGHIEAAEEEIDNLEPQLKEFERSTRGRTRGGDDETRAAKDHAQDAAKDIRNELDRIKRDMEDWDEFIDDIATGETGAKGLTDEMGVKVAEDAAERYEGHKKTIHELFGDLRQAECDWTDAQNRAAARAQREQHEQEKQKRWREIHGGDFQDLAEGMATDTAKDVLGETNQLLSILFAVVDAVEHVAEMSSNQRAILHAFGGMLDAILDARGNLAQAWAGCEAHAIEFAKLTNSNAILGITVELHAAKPLCDALMESARDPAMRETMIRIKNAALSV